MTYRYTSITVETRTCHETKELETALKCSYACNKDVIKIMHDTIGTFQFQFDLSNKLT